MGWVGGIRYLPEARGMGCGGAAVVSGGEGFNVEAWGGGGEAEGFLEDGGAVEELGEVGGGGGGGGAEDGGDFVARFAEAGRVLEEVVERECEQAGVGGGTDEEGDDFVDLLFLGEGGAGFGVLGV